MKQLCAILTLLVYTCLSTQAQIETTFTLHDTIHEGPYIEPENSGYAFLFKNRKEGTLVSTRGQVMNPAVDYHVFNHYHLKEDGNLDSLFSIPIRQDINSHYTMYERGLPKIIQYRVGTSNDPPLARILEKYPIVKTPRINDEPHQVNAVSTDGHTYEMVTQTYNKDLFKETSTKAVIDLETEEGSWKLKQKFSAENIDLPTTLLAYGKEIANDKTRKYNDKMEFRFIAVNAEGEVIRDEEVFYDVAYDLTESGMIYSVEGSLEGFFMSMVESGGRANKEYDATVKKVLYFDRKGVLQNETTLNLPFEPKAKEVNAQKITHIVKSKSARNIYIQTTGIKREKIQDGFFHYIEKDQETELATFYPTSEILKLQDERNNFEGGPPPSSEYAYAVQLENGNLLTIASERGTDLQFIETNTSGKMIRRSAGYMLNDIASQKNILSFEYLDNQKVLISSKVGYEKAVYTSYGIYNTKTGVFQTIQPGPEIATIRSYRNGDDIMVYGNSFEDEKTIHLVLYKLSKRQDSITSLEQEE